MDVALGRSKGKTFTGVCSGEKWARMERTTACSPSSSKSKEVPSLQEEAIDTVGKHQALEKVLF